MQQHAIETIDPRALGRRLQEARKARGITQREVAESLAVARTTITALEKGERRPRPDELITMARLYGRSVGDFVGPREPVADFTVQFRTAVSSEIAPGAQQELGEAIQRFQSLCEVSVVDINTESIETGMALDEKAVDLLEERWSLLSQIREAESSRSGGYGREITGYNDFYAAAYKLLSDDRWPAAFGIADEERERYGDTLVGVASILARNVLASDAGTRYIHVCHPGWDHHVKIWDREAESNHYKLCAEFDQAFSALLEDLASTPSGNNPRDTLLDETLVVAMSEFGRTPGALNNMNGRDHYNRCFPALFAGAGVKGGRVLGRSDRAGEKCLETGWQRKEQPRIENIAATMFSALGIDWSKEIRNAPSGRPYVYVDPLGPNGHIPTDEITTIYG